MANMAKCRSINHLLLYSNLVQSMPCSIFITQLSSSLLCFKIINKPLSFHGYRSIPMIIILFPYLCFLFPMLMHHFSHMTHSMFHLMTRYDVTHISCPIPFSLLPCVMTHAVPFLRTHHTLMTQSPVSFLL